MAQRIKVKNAKNGVISYFNPQKWKKVAENPMFHGVFIVLTPTVPPEVAEIEKRKKASEKQPKNSSTTEEDK